MFHLQQHYNELEGIVSNRVGQDPIKRSELTTFFINDLNNWHHIIATKKLLNEAALTNKTIIYAKTAEFFISGLTERCNIPTEIEMKSNLSSEVLREIIYMLGLDYRDYETKAKLIDETLLKNRNNIAHGKYLLMDDEEFIDLHRAIVDLIDLFSNQISNAAITKAYKRAPSK